MLRHLAVHVVEHAERIDTWPFVQHAVGTGFFPRLRHVLFALGHERLLPFFAPFTERDEMVLQSSDWIAQRPARFLVFRPIARWFVAGGMRSRAIRDELDHRGAEPLARTLGSPAGHG